MYDPVLIWVHLHISQNRLFAITTDLKGQD